MGDWFINAILSFFCLGFMLKEVNLNNIVLTIKEDITREFTKFKPISSCTLTYKLILKILASRMRLVTMF